MTYYASILFWTCLGYAVYHFLWALWFRIAFPRAVVKPNPEFQPKTSIILSLRGMDPFVDRTIEKLLVQDYANYELQVVVDSQSDPVWKVLRKYEGHSRIHISVLEQRRKTCSLKCSAIVQAISNLQSDTEIIALIDADNCPTETWLSTLVSPLADRSIGVVTGNQWFSPKENRAGSIVRSLWNAGAIIVTFLAKHTWAGSCAMRLSEVKESGLIEKWQNTIVDDGPIDGAMRKLKVKTVFLSNLVTVNQEECDLRFSIQYNSRMLTWSRIYEWGFVATFLHMLFTVCMVLGAVVATIGCAVTGDFLAAVMPVIGLLSIQITLVFGYLVTQAAIKIANPHRTSQITPFDFRRAIKFFLIIPIALGVYAISAIRATFAKKVRWRNAIYQIRSQNEIQLLDDQPFAASSVPVDRSTSI